MAVEPELPIIQAFYDFILWINPRIAKFPRDQRFTLGERLEKQLYFTLEHLIRAKYTSDRKKILEEINLELEVMRFHIRLARDLRCLSFKQYGAAAKHITDIGRQVGGWQRAASRRP